MGYDTLSLQELIRKGLRHGPNRGTGSLNQKALTGLRKIQLNTLHDPVHSAMCASAIELLLRHVEPTSADLEDRLSDLAAVYLLTRAADDSAALSEMEGGTFTIERVKAFLGCVNPLFRTVKKVPRALDLKLAHRATHCQPVFKQNNPFRPDTFAMALTVWWESLPEDVDVPAALLTLIFTAVPRSEDIIHFLQRNTGDEPLLFDTPACLGSLYTNVIVPEGVHAATVGVLVEGLLVPFWQQRTEHPVAKLAKLRDPRKAAEMLKTLHDIESLSSQHIAEYIAVADSRVGRLKWCSGGKVPKEFLDVGLNTHSFLDIVYGLERKSDAECLNRFTLKVAKKMPLSVKYKVTKGPTKGTIVPFIWKGRIDAVVMQSNIRELLTVLRTWLTGEAGDHYRPKCIIHFVRRPFHKRYPGAMKRRQPTAMKAKVIKSQCIKKHPADR